MRAPPPRYNNKNVECVDCPLGKYAPTAQTGACLTCNAGFQTGNATGASVCSPCAAGTYSQGSAVSCKDCPVGTWSACVCAAAHKHANSPNFIENLELL